MKSVIYIGNKLAVHGNTPTNIDTLGPLLEREGYGLIYASSKKKLFSRMLDMVSTILKNRHRAGVVLIDTYSTTAFYYAVLCGITARFCRLPYMPILHGGNLPERIRKSPAIAAGYFGKSANNIVISEYLQKLVSEQGLASVLIPNNIDLNTYPFIHRSNLRPRLLWVRSFHEIYNPEMAIEVLAKLRTDDTNFRLLMVGPDKDGSLHKCKATAASLGVADHVEFTGRLSRSEWVERSGDCDFFLNTTHLDNLPVSLIEAMALGMVVVSTNVGGIPYLVKDGDNGVLVPDNSADQMAEEIRKLSRDATRAAHLSEQARETAATFDWNRIKTQWNQVLRPFTDTYNQS